MKMQKNKKLVQAAAVGLSVCVLAGGGLFVWNMYGKNAEENALTEPKKNVTLYTRRMLKSRVRLFERPAEQKRGFPAKEQFDWRTLLWHSALPNLLI